MIDPGWIVAGVTTLGMVGALLIPRWEVQELKKRVEKLDDAELPPRVSECERRLERLEGKVFNGDEK